LPIFNSLRALITPPSHAPIDNAHLLTLIVAEPILIGFLGALLWIRGWTPATVGLGRPRLVDLPLGIGLGLLCQALFVGCWTLCWYITPNIIHLVHPRLVSASHLSWTWIALVSAINPFFEEIFVCAYPIAIARRTRWTTVGVVMSILIRATYHLYQGPLALFAVVPLGIVFALYFATTGRLWPLIVAHMALDLFGLGVHSG